MWTKKNTKVMSSLYIYKTPLNEIFITEVH
jgi:hypothetical protein